MTGFDTRISGVGKDSFTNFTVTTNTTLPFLFFMIKPVAALLTVSGSTAECLGLLGL